MPVGLLRDIKSGFNSCRVSVLTVRLPNAIWSIPHSCQSLIIWFRVPCSMEERFEYYWRVYTLAFQLGMKLAVRCEGFRHIIAISAPGCNITYSPFIWLDDRGQASRAAHESATL